MLVRELNSLGLTIDPKGVSLAKVGDEESEDAGLALAKAAGAEIVATPELLAENGPMEIEEARI